MTAKKPKCTKCDDTGVIDTGNNDFPCDCPAGDKAQFNSCRPGGGVALLTGKQVRTEMNAWRGSPEQQATIDEAMKGRKR